ncbi:hypothetical protein GCM10010123_22600 [Pilimelia anulata]|uniref:Uncharacterized protein n=1 Tax=Pilimelia anulata TaxID=53371 RepID=A0A8J3B480_9ACTN|nr:hypothetical protein [Pilimelia anulata]GGJ92268.1 hypothetical protein GCM10010123_22600 [Pilimelia anulata]
MGGYFAERSQTAGGTRRRKRLIALAGAVALLGGMLTLTNVSSAAEVNSRGGGGGGGGKRISQLKFNDDQVDAANRRAAQLVQNAIEQGGLSNAEIQQVIDAGVDAEGEAKDKAAAAGADGNTAAVLAAQARARESQRLAAQLRGNGQGGRRG